MSSTSSTMSVISTGSDGVSCLERSGPESTALPREIGSFFVVGELPLSRLAVFLLKAKLDVMLRLLNISVDFLSMSNYRSFASSLKSAYLLAYFPWSICFLMTRYSASSVWSPSPGTMSSSESWSERPAICRASGVPFLITVGVFVASNGPLLSSPELAAYPVGEGSRPPLSSLSLGASCFASSFFIGCLGVL